MAMLVYQRVIWQASCFLMILPINAEKPSINEFEKIPGVITQQLTFTGGGYNYQGTTRGLQPSKRKHSCFFFRETKEELCPPQAIHSEPCNTAPLKKTLLCFLCFFMLGEEKKRQLKKKTLNPPFRKKIKKTSGHFLGLTHPKKINTLPADSRHFPRHLQDTSLAQDPFGDLRRRRRCQELFLKEAPW